MAELYLVRHGQASFGSDNYDQLSDLGHQQSKWLGDYFSERDIQFDAMFTGSLVRHRETAAGICEGAGYRPDEQIHNGLNEFDFQSVATAYLNRYPDHRVAKDAPRSDYYRLLRQAMLAWSGNELDSSQLPESWSAFESRVGDALTAMTESSAKRILVVTSGGAIAMILRHILGYDAATVINMNLQIRNASFSQCFSGKQGIHLNSFNNVPHLDLVPRRHAITYS